MFEPWLQLAARRERPFPLRRRKARAAIDKIEAARLLHQNLDHRLGRAELELSPPIALRFLDRKNAQALRAMRNFGGFLVAFLLR